MQFSLYDFTRDGLTYDDDSNERIQIDKLSQEQINGFTEMFDVECRKFLEKPRYWTDDSNWNWMKCVLFFDRPPYCDYSGGQDWNVERRTIRKLIERTLKKGHFTLDNLISKRIYDPVDGHVDFEMELSEEQKQAFVQVFGYRTRQNTKRELGYFIQNPRGYRTYGIYQRVMFSPEDPYCQYVAGQHYPSEVATVRSLILGK